MSETRTATQISATQRASNASDGKLFIQKKDALKTAETGQYEGRAELLRKCAECPECHTKPIYSERYGFICPLCGRQKATLEEWNGKPEQLRLFR